MSGRSKQPGDPHPNPLPLRTGGGSASSLVRWFMGLLMGMVALATLDCRWAQWGSLHAAALETGLVGPQLSLLRHGEGNRSAALQWSNAGSGVGYTIETRSSLQPQVAWSSASASVWPVSTNAWTDPLVPDLAARFYRVVSSPAVAERGKLLAIKDMGPLSPAEINAIIGQIGVPLSAGTGVRLYKLSYETVNPFDLRTLASGLLVVPQNPTRPLPLISYQHGTIVSRGEVPSAMQGLERVIGIVLGASGYVAALPDYVGLGDSPGLHPFVHAHSEATAAVDMLRAARQFCASSNVALNGQLFLVGYSEGGHATMATHREIETFHTNEFTITASAPMAGPYDLSGTMVQDFLSGRSMPNPYYFIYLLAAYQSIYHFAPSLSDILASPFDRTLPPLLDGQHDGSDLNRAIGTSVPIDILKPEFLADFKNNMAHPLRLALRENDLYDWTPRAPMRLYHCDGDQDVLYANSTVAYNSFHDRGAPVELVNPFPSADHGTCAPFALLAAKLTWFDTLVQR